MSNQYLEHQQRNQTLTDAENCIKEACEILQREATRVRQEQEAIDSMSKKLDHVHVSSTVKLNVGGQHFTTSAQTLRKDPNSMLAAMFSGKFHVKPSEDGSFFIDRDGTHFRFILNYLRTGKLTLPEGATFLKELEEEAEFYEIQGIFDALRLPAQVCKPTKPFEESTILTNAERQQILNGWLPTDLKGEWRLLFLGSRDGFTAENFHSRCDNKGPTVTIVQSGENIFGGFTEKSWRSQGGHVTCSQAFLFSMVNQRCLRLGPTKLPLVTGQEQYAIYCGSNYGPTFGGGEDMDITYILYDLHISANANTNTSSFSDLGNAYHRCSSGEQSMFWTGSSHFTVTDYEVFALKKMKTNMKLVKVKLHFNTIEEFCPLLRLGPHSIHVVV